jgi:hypothetical protein
MVMRHENPVVGAGFSWYAVRQYSSWKWNGDPSKQETIQQDRSV